MRAIGQNTPAETIVNLGRKYQGERPFRHPKADLVRKVLLKAAISFQSRRPYRGETTKRASQNQSDTRSTPILAVCGLHGLDCQNH